MPKVMLAGFRCERCLHEWLPREDAREPRVCPKCKSPYWDKPRRSLTSKGYESLVPIERAQQDIRDLNFEIAAFLKRYPCGVIAERQTHPQRVGPLSAVFRPTKEYIDGMTPGLVRNAFANLRAALDDAVAAKVLERGGSRQGVFFPIIDSVDNLEASIQNALVERASPQVVRFIRELEAYPGGKGAWLWAACRVGLNLYHLGGSGGGIFLGYSVVLHDLTNMQTGRSVPLPGNEPVRRICTQNTNLVPVLPEANFQVGDDIQAEIAVALLDGLPLKGLPILEALSECATEVARTLDGFRALD